MLRRFVAIILECLVDLGITMVYATFAGVLIAAIAASDSSSSFLSSLLVAALLPAAVFLLIALDAGCRLIAERRARRRPDHRSTFFGTWRA